MSVWRRVLTERRGLVVPLFIALAVNLATLVLGVLPLKASVSGAESRAMAVKADLRVAQRLERVANDTRTSEQRAGQELKKFYADVLPASYSSARDLMYQELRTISRQNGLGFSGSTFAPEPVDESSLMRFKEDVTLTGDYSNVRRFLYDLETTQEFFIVESVRLASSNQKDSKGSLEVLLEMVTYYQGTRR